MGYISGALPGRLGRALTIPARSHGFSRIDPLCRMRNASVARCPNPNGSPALVRTGAGPEGHCRAGGFEIKRSSRGWRQGVQVFPKQRDHVRRTADGDTANPRRGKPVWFHLFSAMGLQEWIEPAMFLHVRLTHYQGNRYDGYRHYENVVKGAGCHS